MGKNKLERFRHNQCAGNVIEEGKALYDTIKGNWRSRYFHNNNPVILELACGRGEYTTGLANLFPDYNFIGVDVKGARIWKASKTGIEYNLQNIALLRIRIHMIEDFFEKDEVDGIWLTFPDPRPKKSDMHRRLTHPRYLNCYRSIMKKDGLVHLKTDNDQLFAYTLEVLEQENIKPDCCTFDLYQSDLLPNHYGIRTRYETEFLKEGKTIKYMAFRL